MAFWANGKTEIKRSYRWLGFVHLYNYVDPPTGQTAPPSDPKLANSAPPAKPNKPRKKTGVTIPPFVIKSFTKPTFAVPINELGGPDGKTGVLQLKPGPPRWQPVTITAIDVEDSKSNVTRILHSWMLRSGYDSSSESFAKSSNLLRVLGDGSFISISLNQLDSNGNIFEKWVLEKPILEEFNFGDAMDYSNDQLVTVNMKFNIAAAKYIFIREPENEASTGLLPF